MYGKITETGAIRIATEKLEGYKPIVEERQNKSEEKQSVTDGAIEELATLMSEVVSNG